MGTEDAYVHGEGGLQREKKKADVHRRTVVRGHVVGVRRWDKLRVTQFLSL